MQVNSKYYLLIESIFRSISAEYERLYWNKNQKEANSPFENSGGKYGNDTFSVQAYNWDGKNDWNFQYKDWGYKNFRASWYKYYTRGLYAEADQEIGAEFLSKMLTECLEAMRKDFGEKE